MNPRYPVYIPSLGRWGLRSTAKVFEAIRVPYRIVVEPKEYEQYAAVIDPAKILVLPGNYSEAGTGSIPARNWIWEHSLGEGWARHWLVDDNIDGFYRMNENRRAKVADGTIFRCVEDFTERYDNVAFSGMNKDGFAKVWSGKLPPFYLNTRVYCTTLINNAVPYRWRGKYNEDTDICLRALKDGWATINFNAFLCNKVPSMRLAGGNTDTIYATGDKRRAFAESLVAQHPDVARVTWKFNRWHHHVDYSPFKRNDPRRRADVEVAPGVDDYGMVLERV